MELSEIIKLMNSPSRSDITLVTEAFSFAKSAHQGQTRFSGEPYFIHPFETAKILADLGMSAVTISAGLLHDCLEEGEIKEQEIEDKFGEEILFLVQGTTKLGKLKYRGVQRHNESLRKLFVAISRDIRIILIKLSDRLHNLRTLQYVPENKRLRIATETLEIYVPIAYRLGIRKLNRQLEDLAFPYVYPEEFQKTTSLLKKRLAEDMEHLNKFQKSVKKILFKKGIIKFSLDYRIKTLYSLFKKLEKKDWNIENIYDISALRIVVFTTEECYRILGIIHGTWRPLPGRIKDYIAFPKPNGYRALHTTIFTGYGNVVEIQIKTKEQYRESEYGIASHLSYKEKRPSNFFWIRRLLPFRNTLNKKSEKKEINFDDVPSWIKELVEFQKTTKEEAEIKEELQGDFFQQRIFVFTPKGDVIDLPIGSSPIDFAYAIHSDIGNHIFGAKVNGKITSLESCLTNGNIVEIITKKESSPSQKWLKYVKTNAARKGIRTALQAKGK